MLMVAICCSAACNNHATQMTNLLSTRTGFPVLTEFERVHEVSTGFPNSGCRKVKRCQVFPKQTVLCEERLVRNQIRTSSPICGMRALWFSNSGVTKVHYATKHLENY
jgi:hypothetical protein